MKQVPNPHDTFFKRTFARLEVAAEFLRHYLPAEVAGLLDLTQLTLEKDSFVDAKLRQHFSDLLYRVGLKEGGAAYVYILLEHKSAPEEWVALQLLRYLAQAWEQLRRAGSARLPLIIPVVCYHGAVPWRVGLRLRDLSRRWPPAANSAATCRTSHTIFATCRSTTMKNWSVARACPPRCAC